MKIRYILLTFCLTMSCILIAQSEKIDQLVRGNQFYEQGEYQQAIDAYTVLVEEGYHSEDLFFNLGNAYFKNRNTAKAILYYEKALKINPASEDAQFNLSIANEQTVDKVEAIPELFLYRWWKALYNLFPADTWAKITIALLLLSLIGFALFKLIASVANRKIGFYLFVGGLALALFTFFLASRQKAYLLSEEYAIIIEPTVNIISAPSDGSSQLFVLHEGTKVKVKDNSAEWLKVALPNGNEGWIKRDELEII